MAPWLCTARAGLRVEWPRADVVASFGGGPPLVLDGGLDPGDGGEVGEARSPRIGPGAVQPVGGAREAAGAPLDAAPALVEGGAGLQFAFERGVEVGLDLGVQGGLVGLHRQQVIGTGGGDGFGCGRVAAHGVDGEQGALKVQPLQEGGDGRDLVGLVLHRFPAQHQTAPRSEGGHQVQGTAARGLVVAAAQALAVYGDQIGAAGEGFLHPGREAAAEQIAIDAVHQGRQPVRRARRGGRAKSGAGNPGAPRPRPRWSHRRRSRPWSRTPTGTAPPAADRPPARAVGRRL